MNHDSAGSFHGFKDSELHCLSQLSFSGLTNAKKKMFFMHKATDYAVPRWYLLYIYLSLAFSELFEFVTWCFALHVRKLQPFFFSFVQPFVFSLQFQIYSMVLSQRSPRLCSLFPFNFFLTSAFQIEWFLSNLSSSSLILSSAIFKLC